MDLEPIAPTSPPKPPYQYILALCTLLLLISTGFLAYQNMQLKQELMRDWRVPPPTAITPKSTLDQIDEPQVIPTGATCGGIVGKKCPNGETCKITSNYPDAMGTCAKSTLTCPSNGWVDCEPSPNAGIRYECTPEAMNWYKENCPNFQGGAL